MLVFLVFLVFLFIKGERMLSQENQINLLFFDGFLAVLVGRGWDF